MLLFWCSFEWYKFDPKMKKRNNFPSFGDVSQCDVTSCQFQDTYTCCYCSRSCLPNKETCARTPGRSNRSAKVTGMTSDQMASRPWFALDRIFKTRSCAIGKMKMKMFQNNIQAVLDTVHVTNFVQSNHCRWRTDSFTFVRVVSSIFFDFRRLSSDLR